MAQVEHITRLLNDLSGGRRSAVDDLLPAVYDELKAVAAAHMGREPSDHTLQATAVVHEAYLRMVDQTRVRWQDRAHFLAVAATAIRRVLVDHARRRKAGKRGSGWNRVQSEAAADMRPLDFVALEEALVKLAEYDTRKARVVELRFFGGMNIEEAAEVLGVAHATVERDWRMARAWLLNEISDEP